jgi:hypothetical protein
MRAQFTLWLAVVAGGVVACRDSSAAPREVGAPRFATASDTGGGGPGQFHFVANGDAASVNWASGDSSGTGGGLSFTTGFLQVSRGGPTNNPQTFMSYQVEQTVCDPFFNCTFTLLQGGFGSIPNGDFSGGGKQLRLRTNAATNPNFIVFAGTGGLVSVTWQANGFFFSSSNGTSTFKSGTFTERFQGNSSSASAAATGTVIGIPINANQSSGIGSNHTVQIDIFR